MSAADKAKTTYKTYSTMCLKSGYTVPASTGAMSSGAMAAQPPAGATGKCKDGTYTMATTHSGYYVTGEADFVLVISARDMDDFDLFTRRFFYEQPDIKGFKTMVVIDRVKASFMLPLVDN
jgi:hypothetical protein